MNDVIINLSIVFEKPTGISNYITNLLPYLKSLQPTLLTSQTYQDFNCYSIPGDMTPLQGTKGHFRRLLWTQLKLPKIASQLQAKLLFSPQPEAPIFTKTRYIIQVHDLIPLRFPQPNSPLTQYFSYYLPFVLKQAEHIICNSQATAKDIQEYYGIQSSKITPILLAHNSAHFHPNLYRVKSEVNYFLYLGRQDPYKNLNRLIQSFAKLIKQKSHLKEYQLWLAGPCDRRFTPTLQTHIQELEITPQVKFLDYVPFADLPNLISGATALVFPSLWEGFGFPVLEAMACGTPVITSNISSLPEVAGDAAILVNPYSIEEITAAMQTIASDSQLRSHLSHLGLQRAKQFSWEKTAKQTIEVLSAYL